MTDKQKINFPTDRQLLQAAQKTIDRMKKELLRLQAKVVEQSDIDSIGKVLEGKL